MPTTAQTRAKDVRQQVGAELQPVLADLIDLSLQGKQLHWNVVGSHFASLHGQLDKLVEDAREWSDEVAERLRALELSPEGQAGTVAKQSALSPLPAGTVADRDVVKHTVERLTTLASRGRAAIERLDTLDKISQDMLIEIVERVEKHLWMFRAQAS